MMSTYMIGKFEYWQSSTLVYTKRIFEYEYDNTLRNK